MKTTKTINARNGRSYCAELRGDHIEIIDVTDDAPIWVGSGRLYVGMIIDCDADIGEDAYVALDHALSTLESRKMTVFNDWLSSSVRKSIDDVDVEGLLYIDDLARFFEYGADIPVHVFPQVSESVNWVAELSDDRFYVLIGAEESEFETLREAAWALYLHNGGENTH